MSGVSELAGGDTYCQPIQTVNSGIQVVVWSVQGVTPKSSRAWRRERVEIPDPRRQGKGVSDPERQERCRILGLKRLWNDRQGASS